MKQEIVLSIMGVIVSIELVCGVLIILLTFLKWVFGTMQTRIVNTEVARMHRPATLSESMGLEPVSSEPVRAEPVGPNVSVRVEVGGDVAVQIDVGPDKKPQVEAKDMTPDDTWSDF